jgi:hypothetical protein
MFRGHEHQEVEELEAEFAQIKEEFAAMLKKKETPERTPEKKP